MIADADQHELRAPALQPEPPPHIPTWRGAEGNREPQRLPWPRQVAHFGGWRGAATP